MTGNNTRTKFYYDPSKLINPTRKDLNQIYSKFTNNNKPGFKEDKKNGNGQRSKQGSQWSHKKPNAV